MALAGKGIDLAEGEGARSVAEQLRDTLSKHAVRVIDLFREWDDDASGTVDKREFRRAMPLLGLDVPRAEVDRLFETFDPDGTGTITFDELHTLLRRGNEVELDAKLLAGGAGVIETESANLFALRGGLLGEKQTSSLLRGVDLDESKPVAEQLRETLAQHAVRVIDLFREWDKDGDGTVSKREFRKAMPLLGLDVPRAEVDALFDSWDPDRSGSVELAELSRMLRKAPARVSASGPSGPVLPRNALILVLGPTAPEKSTLCRRLVHSFGGSCLAAEALADREVRASSDLGREIARLRADAHGLLLGLTNERQRGEDGGCWWRRRRRRQSASPLARREHAVRSQRQRMSGLSRSFQTLGYLVWRLYTGESRARDLRA